VTNSLKCIHTVPHIFIPEIFCQQNVYLVFCFWQNVELHLHGPLYNKPNATAIKMAISKKTRALMQDFANAPGEPPTLVLQDRYGETELMRSAIEGNLSVVAELLALIPEGERRQAYIGLCDKHGKNALMLAVVEGNLGVVEALIAMAPEGSRTGCLKAQDR
jgi:ankyrin repeat protein